MVSGTNRTDTDQYSPFSEYTPAALKCISMMSLGYLSGRLGLLSPSEAEGINKFASYWALPSLLYLMVVTNDASSIRWKLISALLLGKLAIFVVVALFCIVIRVHRTVTTACFYAAFCTVTNDAGLGNVLVQGLCAKKCPEMPIHLFYVQPLSMLLIHTLAFWMMKKDDFGGWRRRQFFKHLFGAAWRTSKNPLTLAFVAGLITKASLRHPLPYYFRYLLEVIIAAFPANILFLLGMSMVGKFRALVSVCCSDCKTWIPFTTFFIKMIATPVILHLVVNNFPDSEDKSKEFAFLYGVMSPSMQAVSIAKEYGIPTDPIASTLALLNLAFLPLSYVASKAAFDGLEDYGEIMKKCLFFISIASFLLSVVANVLLCKKRDDHANFIVIKWLLVCQVALALGAIVKLSFKGRTVVFDIDKALVFNGQVTCNIWAANLTASLYLNCRFKFEKTTYLLPVGFGIPAILTTCVLIFSVYLPSEKLPFTLEYDVKWLIVGVVVTGCSLIITVLFLCLSFRYMNFTAFESCAENQERNVYAIPISTEGATEMNHLKNPSEHTRRAGDRNASCQQQYGNGNLSQSAYGSCFDKKLLGFTVVLCALMTQTFIAQLLKLTYGASKGVLSLVEFLSLAGNFGQGIITFFWFGVSLGPVISSVKQRWRAMAEVFYHIAFALRRRSRKVDISL